MNIFGDAAIALFTALLCYFGVEIFRHQSIVRKWVDIPNERSSHSRPTPRGGGLIIVLICLVGYIGIGIVTPSFFSWGYFAGATILSVASWIDDLRSLSVKWRLAVQFASALLVVISDGYFGSVGLTTAPQLVFGAFGIAVTLLWIIWVVNAYNFMDGIDGIAAIQAIVAATGWAVLAAILGEPQLTLFCMIILSASVGFVVHNWSPARIFLGDVGSAFFGYTFALIPLLAGRNTGSPSWLPLAGLFMIWPFMFDSGVTLLHRLTKKQTVWKPHREHVYQGLVIAGYSHSAVALAYLVFAALSVGGFLITIEYAGTVAIFYLLFLLLITGVFVISTVVMKRKTIR